MASFAQNYLNDLMIRFRPSITSSSSVSRSSPTTTLPCSAIFLRIVASRIQIPFFVFKLLLGYSAAMRAPALGPNVA